MYVHSISYRDLQGCHYNSHELARFKCGSWLWVSPKKGQNWKNWISDWYPFKLL